MVPLAQWSLKGGKRQRRKDELRACEASTALFYSVSRFRGHTPPKSAAQGVQLNTVRVELT